VDLISDVGGIIGHCASPSDDTSCDRFQDRIREFTLADEYSSASVVRVSIVEMSIR
jgi:hypothetical protein